MTGRGASAGRATILVVEDNALALKSTALQLESLGYDVLSARDGPESLRVLEDGGEVDVVLTDVILPRGMTGSQLADEVQRRDPRIKVILMSGYPRDELLSDGKIGDDTPVMVKPFPIDDLVPMIERLLAGGASE
jgi:CheY-like chemotaxis protein